MELVLELILATAVCRNNPPQETELRAMSLGTFWDDTIVAARAVCLQPLMEPPSTGTGIASQDF